MNRFAMLSLGCVVVSGLPFASGQAPQITPQKENVPASVSSAPASQIVPPPPNYRFPNGQTYVYGVEWHLFNAGTARVTMESASGEERVSAVAESSGVVNVLYGVHDRFQGFFDPGSFCSLRVSKHTEEGFHKRETEIRFDYPARKSVLDEKNLKTGERKHTENDIPNCVTDVVSGFYYLASLPLQPGNRHTFPVNDGGKTTGVTAQVEAREQVKVPAGAFQTVRVQAEAVSGPLKGTGKIWVWYTDDANHIPVQMRTKLGWGTLMFRMQSLER